MLRRWNSRLLASVGDDGARVRLVRRRADGRTQVVYNHAVTPEPAPADIEGVVSALDQALREASASGHDLTGLRCNVVVSDAWMLYDVVEADLGDTTRRAADDLVSAALADTAGVKPSEIITRWQRQGEARNFACALPVSAMQALQGVLHRHKLRLGSVEGELVSIFNSSRHGLSPKRSVIAVPRPAGTQLGLIVDGGFTALRYEPGVCNPMPLLERSRALMRCAGFEPDIVTSYYADETLPVDADTPWVRHVPRRQWRRRLAARNELAQLDFDLSPTRARVPPMSWLLLVAGALAVTLAAFQFQTASGQHLREARELRALEVSLNETRAGGAVRALPQDVHSARATAAVVRELQVPWATLFAALESVAGRNVALLSVEPSALRQEVRIVAEAKTSGAMLDFLEALRAQSLREVVLVSHQLQAQTPGAPIRFQARALWGSQ